jgi:hypothetical protein
MGVSSELGRRATTPAAVAGCAAALVALPVLVDLAVSDRSQPLGYLAPDAFYYFTVARNISRLGSISFDQEHPTNGFHPLWQWLMAGCHWLLDRLSLAEQHLFVCALVLGALFAAAGIYWLGRATALERGRLSSLYVLVPAGVLSPAFVLWMSLRVRDTGRMWTSCWHAINGMETGAVLCGFGACSWLFVRNGARSLDALWLGLALSVLTLARLDHGIFALLIVAFVGWEGIVTRARAWRSAAIVTLVWGSCLALYLLTNRLYSGMWLPISGSIKSSYPKLAHNNFDLLRDVWLRHGRLRATLLARGILLSLPSLVVTAYPLALGLLWLLKRLDAARRFEIEPRPGRYGTFLLLGALGVVLLGAYDLCYVPAFNIGHWYFPIATLLPSLMLADLAGRIGIARKPAWLGAPLTRLTAIGALAAAVLALFVRSTQHGSPGRLARFYYDEAPLVAAAYGGNVPPLVEYDDGIIAFATGARSMSGLGLTIDKDAVADAGGIGKDRKARRSRGLMDLAIERGYVRCATLTYAAADLSLSSSDRVIRKAYRNLLGRFATNYRFRVEYLSADGAFSIVRGEPRNEPGAAEPESTVTTAGAAATEASDTGPAVAAPSGAAPAGDADSAPP